jgi:ABC-type dipeptide/oligopeptide/nickel transport system permease component
MARRSSTGFRHHALRPGAYRRVDRQLAVHVGRELLPVPGAARRPGAHTRPQPARQREQVQGLRETLGLDQALPQQFLTYLEQPTFTGEFGISYRFRVPVGGLILRPPVARRWCWYGTGTLLATIIGLPHRHPLSVERGGPGFDRYSTGTTLTLYLHARMWWLG